MAGSGKNQSDQVAALIAAAEYVDSAARRNAFTRKPQAAWPGKGVREMGEKLRSLADIRSHGGVVTPEEIEVIVSDLNRLGLFFDEDVWDQLASAFPPEC